MALDIVDNRVIVGSKRAGARSLPEGYSKVLVDRTTSLGNPFHIHDTKANCVEDHRRWLSKVISDKSDKDIYLSIKRLAKRVNKGEHIALICWCNDGLCHANNIKDEVYKFAAKLKG